MKREWAIMKLAISTRLFFLATLLLSIFCVLFFESSASAKDDYYYRDESHPDCRDENFSDVDKWDFYKMNCTSFVAWRMNRDGVDFKNGKTYGQECHWGNAGDWDDNARQKLNIPVNNIPDVGSVAQWEAQGSGAFKYGHVAYVESVNANASVNISEYNFDNPCEYGERSNVQPDHYIHVISLITADGSKVYWLQNNKIYHVIDADTLNTMQNTGIPGWKWSYTTTVSSLSPYTVGPEFISTNSSSNGLLIRLYQGTDVYLINNGQKEYLSYETFTQGGYDWNDIIDVPQAILDIFPVADSVLPTVSAFSVTPGSLSLGNSFTISYTVSDTGGSGLKQVELWRANDSSGSPVGWAEIKSTSLSGNGPSSGSFSDAPSSTGDYWYGIHVVDNAGNWSTEPDPPGPIKGIVRKSCTYSISPTSKNFSSSGGSQAVTVDASRSDCSWSVSESFSWVNVSPTSGTGDGSVTVTISSNSGSSRSGTATIAGEDFDITQDAADTTQPDTSITGGPSGTIDYNDVTFTYTGSDDVTSTSNLVYSYKLDGYDSSWSSYTSSTSKSYSDLPNASYTFYVKAKDQAGNVDSSPASRSFTVDVSVPDTEAPDTSITSGPSGTIDYNDVSFTYTGSDDVTSTSNLVYSYKLDGYDSSWSSYTSLTSTSYNDLPNASYTFYVKAKDQAGNLDSSPASRSFTVNYTPPDTGFYILSGTITVNGVPLQIDDMTPMNWGEVSATEVSGANQGNRVNIPDGGHYQMALFPGTYNVQLNYWFSEETWDGNWTYFSIYGHPVAENLSISGDTTLDIPLTVYTLTGRVVDTNGIGVPDVEVSTGWWNPQYSSSTRTSADGSYKLYLLSGTYSLQINPPSGTRFAATSIEVDISGNATQDIVLEEQFLLSGTVTVNGVPVQIDDMPPTNWGEVSATEISGANQGNSVNIPDGGHYQMALFPGTYNVQLNYWFSEETWDGNWTYFSIYGHPVAENLSISGDTTLDIPLTVYTLTGRVVDTNGIGVPDVEVSTGWWNPQYSSSTRTSADGSYKLYLLSGTYSLQIRPPPEKFPPFEIKKVHVSGDTVRNITLSYEYTVLDQAIAMLSPDLELYLDVFDIINQGASKSYDIPISAPREHMQIIINWGSSEMRASVYRPDGSLYGQYQSETPPIIVDIPNPEVGVWKCVVTAIEVPYDNYPIAFVAGITPEEPPIQDSDGDGVPDDQDAFPNDRNEWLDTDGDGMGNNTDEDDDNDGMPDDWENIYGLNPLVDDSGDDFDGDGYANLIEYQSGTDPNDINSHPSAACNIKGNRKLPKFVESPSDGNPVSIDIDIVDEERTPNGLIVKEYVPQGWEVSNVEPPIANEFDPEVGEMKWVFIGDDVVDRTIEYKVDVPAGEEEGTAKTFSGQLLYNDPVSGDPYECSISGDEEVNIGCDCNPYDANSDWVLGDFEILDAIDCWADIDCRLYPAQCEEDFYMLDLIDLWAVGDYQCGPEEAADKCFPWERVP